MVGPSARAARPTANASDYGRSAIADRWRPPTELQVRPTSAPSRGVFPMNSLLKFMIAQQSYSIGNKGLKPLLASGELVAICSVNFAVAFGEQDQQFAVAHPQ